MARRARRRRALVIVLVVLVALIAAGGVSAYTFLTRDDPVVYDNIVEQYKYGSIGTEELQGIPYELWVVMAEVFADCFRLGPARATSASASSTSAGATADRHDIPREADRPSRPQLRALSRRAHTGTLRAQPRQIVLGMPSNRMRLWDYIQFLRKVRRDERFNADTLLAAIERRFPGRLSFFDRQFWRYAVIPEVQKGLREADEDFAWLDSRPPYGPGRVDTFNPLKQRADFDMEADHTVGTVDFPSIWEQRTRIGTYLHWDGNNNSLRERNLSAARAVGGTDDSMDIHQLNRIADWLLDLPPPCLSAVSHRPAARAPRADALRAAVRLVSRPRRRAQRRGDADRADRHRPRAPGLVHARPRHRAEHQCRQREALALSPLPQDGRLRKPPARGIWLRASVPAQRQRPDFRALLFPAERPEVFLIGYDVYDWKNVGFVSSGPAARRDGATTRACAATATKGISTARSFRARSSSRSSSI